MKEALLDIVKIVSVLPFNMVKVTGSDGNAVIQSRLDEEAVILYGKITRPTPEFDGVFGLSNIPMLSGLTNVEAFRDKDASIKIKHLERNGVKIPEEISFEKDGFGKASYRLTGEKAIPPQMKATAQINWDIVVDQPSKRKIGEFAQLAGIYSSQETKFTVKTDNGQLKFLIGDEGGATHKAQVVFAENVKGNIKANHTWNINSVLSVLKLGSNAEMVLSISSQGILQIEVNTGLGVYNFMFAGSN